MQFYNFTNGDAAVFDVNAVRRILDELGAESTGQTHHEFQAKHVTTEEFKVLDDDFEFPVFLSLYTKDGVPTYSSLTTDDAIYVGIKFPDLCYRLICSVGLTGFYPAGDWAPLVASELIAKDLPTEFPPCVIVQSVKEVKEALGLE